MGVGKIKAFSDFQLKCKYRRNLKIHISTFTYSRLESLMNAGLQSAYKLRHYAEIVYVKQAGIKNIVVLYRKY